MSCVFLSEHCRTRRVGSTTLESFLRMESCVALKLTAACSESSRVPRADVMQFRSECLFHLRECSRPRSKRKSALSLEGVPCVLNFHALLVDSTSLGAILGGASVPALSILKHQLDQFKRAFTSLSQAQSSQTISSILAATNRFR